MAPNGRSTLPLLMCGAWLLLVASGLLAARACDAEAVDVAVSTFIEEPPPLSSSTDPRPALMWVSASMVGLGLLAHLVAFIVAMARHRRWRRGARLVSDALDDKDVEEARAAAGQTGGALARAVSAPSRPPGSPRLTIFAVTAWSLLFVAPLLVDLLATEVSRGAPPSLGVHGNSCVAALLLAIPTGINIALALTLEPRRRALSGALATRCALLSAAQHDEGGRG